MVKGPKERQRNVWTSQFYSSGISLKWKKDLYFKWVNRETKKHVDKAVLLRRRTQKYFKMMV